MDAFSVSLANGLNEPKMKRSRIFEIAGVFAGFQCAMPLIGWVCIHTIAQKFEAFQKVIPWIALILLGYIGIKMIIEGVKGDDAGDDGNEPVSFSTLIIQGIATSIDALSVGFTIAEYSILLAVISAAIIGIVTFGICVAGLIIGRTAGTRLAGRANIMGGVILIGIGIEIFLTHLF